MKMIGSNNNNGENDNSSNNNDSSCANKNVKRKMEEEKRFLKRFQVLSSIYISSSCKSLAFITQCMPKDSESQVSIVII